MSLGSALTRLGKLPATLDVAILEVNTKTDLKIKFRSIERAKHRRVVALTFAIKTQANAEKATTVKEASNHSHRIGHFLEPMRIE
jgi:plasmid replication initiation protein